MRTPLESDPAVPRRRHFTATELRNYVSRYDERCFHRRDYRMTLNSPKYWWQFKASFEKTADESPSVSPTDSWKTPSILDIIPRKAGHEVSFLYPKNIIRIPKSALRNQPGWRIVVGPGLIHQRACWATERAHLFTKRTPLLTKWAHLSTKRACWTTERAYLFTKRALSFTKQAHLSTKWAYWATERAHWSTKRDQLFTKWACWMTQRADLSTKRLRELIL